MDRLVRDLTKLGLSGDRSTELVKILHSAAWDVIDAVEGRQRSSHDVCELLTSAAKALEENAPDKLAQQAIKTIVETALDTVGGVVATDPVRTIVVTAVAVHTEKLTAALAVPDIAAVVMALRMLAVLVCPSSCEASEEASRAVGKAVTGETLVDARGNQPEREW